jgi:hypothetical protein
VAVGLRRRDHVGKTFEKLERIWDDYQVYEKDDGSAIETGRRETD